MWERLGRQDHRALRLAGLQVVDIAACLALPDRYGDAHLAALGVPVGVRRVLMPIKVTTTALLVAAAKRPRLRSATAAALVAYYAAAVTFHVDSGDSMAETAPAAFYGLVAAALV